ncbi:general substrate transporter [Stylosanthes scabra]|uniref:General substrate transporter n=1 Tax=Stylosanthes scabra TaxID=79078 RepID=A0ABU6R293_9FABA|nr:general substrate transporter [Stylosanthes scabra]
MDSANDATKLPPPHAEEPTVAPPTHQSSPLRKIITVATLAIGIQFVWALQLTILTPYVQILGTPHMWVSFIWLCGPISGIIVQPLVGFYSDRCTSRFGPRRPFIIAGTLSVVFASFLVGYAADIGHSLGNSDEATLRPRTIAVFIMGFWIIDFANNLLQGPCRAFIADLAAGHHSKTRTGYAFYTLFTAVGNILGSAAGSYGGIHRVLPFTKTTSCDEYCADVKTCFLFASAIQLALVTISATYVKEKPLRITDSVGNGGKGGIGELFGALRELKRPMWIVLLVTSFNWFAWFPFLLYNTDWMGVEVYGAQDKKERVYTMGVHAGALGMMLNSVVAGAASLGIGALARGFRGEKRLWGVVNFLLAVCLAMTVVVSKMAGHSRRYAVGNDGFRDPLPPPAGVKAAALTLYSVLGLPFAVTCSIPYTLASIFSSAAGAGQGLSLAILNLAVVIPQMVMSLVSGPWDKLFGGNLPAFVLGAVAAAISGILSLLFLPSPPPDFTKPATVTHNTV